MLIYLIRDDVGEVIWVGKTNDLARRRREHSRRFQRRIELEVIEEAGADWQERERFWIAHYRAVGAPLTNTALGGHGGPVHAQSTRDLLSRKGRGRPKPDGFGDALSAKMKGSAPKWSDGGRERIAATQFKPGASVLDSLPPERLAARSEKLSVAAKALTSEERSRRNRKTWSAMTPEERSARGRAAAEGRRRAAERRAVPETAL